jgi:aminoglycoside 3-N-acetyltransferase
MAMVTKRQIRDALFHAGIRTGDHLLVHSSLRRVGPIDGGADALIDGLLEAVGSSGTLAMPAFNSTRHMPVPYFDVHSTPSRAGMLTEIFRKRPEVLRSYHPTHSVAAQGERAVEFLANHHDHEALGIDSPLDRLARAGGYVLLMGVTHMANASIHVGESHAGIQKFYWDEGPLPVVKCRLSDGRVIDYRLDCSPSCSMAFNVAEYPLRRHGMVVDLNVGAARSFLIKGQDIIRVVVDLIRDKQDALLCHRDSCRPCIMARKYIQESGREK